MHVSVDKKLINDFLSNPSEKNMHELLEYSRANELNDDAIETLAIGLSNSGKKITLSSKKKIYDIPSTGGPTSLSTLLSPLFLVEMGKSVLKLGVPGRPAGGVDVMAQIKGYKVTPEIQEILAWLEKCNYVHFLANKDFAPLDALLFKFRKDNGGINIPSLVVASLISKKIAVGLTNVGLDIRVSSFGNFGTSVQVAVKNAELFNRVAMRVGINSKCFLTNGNVPQQPFIGRGEALLALHEIFSGRISSMLKKHIDFCHQAARDICESKGGSYSINKIEDIFFDNVITQGGSKAGFEEVVFDTKKGHTFSMQANRAGYLRVDIEVLRDVIVQVQSKNGGEFPDPCGIILNFTTNEQVKSGDQICSVRCPENEYKEFSQGIARAFEFSDDPHPVSSFEKVI